MVGIVNKPDINYGIWASNGDVAVPSSEKVEIGHIVEKPKKEIVNWIENRQDQFMAYLNQVGVSEWDIQTEYPVNAYTSRGGTLYKALSQNKDRDPTLFPLIWKLAFTTYEDYLSVLSELDKIKNQDGYLNSYVSKSAPVMTAPAQGVAYGFTGDSDTGLVKDSGGNPAIQKDGVVIASFDQLEQDNSVVRFSDLRKYLEFYKVGDLYITTNSNNPSTILGYGTWVLHSKGRALVGLSNNESDPVWTRFIGSVFGEYNHQLTVDEMPKHNHTFAMNPQDQGSADSADGTGGASTRFPTDYTGGDKPHNNVQPSHVVAIWRRIS